MYALINTMNRVPGDSIGAVLSRHRTVEAAKRADTQIQRRVKRGHGQNSYLPTAIVELTRKPRGRYLAADEWRVVGDD